MACGSYNYAAPLAAHATAQVAAVAAPLATHATAQVAAVAAPYAHNAAYAYANAPCAPETAASPSVPAAQLAAPLSTAHFSYNGVAKIRTLAAAAKAAAANAAAAAEAATAAAVAADARAKALAAIADARAAKLQKDLDEVHAAHSRIARQTTYPCLSQN